MSRWKKFLIIDIVLIAVIISYGAYLICSDDDYYMMLVASGMAIIGISLSLAGLYRSEKKRKK